MAKIQIKNSFITSSAQITISSSLVKFSGGISAKGITGSVSGSFASSNIFTQGGNSFGTTAILGTNDSQALTFETNNSEKVRIDTSGNLLVGTTTSPSSTGLSIGVTGTVRQLLGGMQNTSWRMREKSAIDWCAWTTNINDAGTQDDATKSSWLTQQGFGNGNDAWRVGRYPVGSSTLSEFIYINSSGNVGIGTTSPGAKLHVSGSSATSIIDGLRIGRGAGNVVSNTVVGNSAFISNTTGVFNVAVGVNSLASNISGAYNIALGGSALLSNTIGLNNIGIGVNALYYNTTGSSNTAVGTYALQNNIANNNSAFGHQSLFNNTTGASNTAMGYLTLNTNVIGNNNTAVGFQSLYSNTTDSNRAFGY